MKTILMSDTHFGAKIANPNIVLRFWREAEFDRLILLGDIQHFHAEVEDRIKMSIALVDLINSGKEVIWLIGNHDDDRGTDELGYSKWKQAMERMLPNVTFAYDYILEDKGLRILLMHGHQLTGDDSTFSRLVVKWFGKFQDLLGSKFRGVYKGIDTVERWITGSYKKVREGAVKRAVLGNYHVVICGHAHKEEVSVHEVGEDRRILYLNTGDWLGSRDEFPYVTLDWVENEDADLMSEIELKYYKPL